MVKKAVQGPAKRGSGSAGAECRSRGLSSPWALPPPPSPVSSSRCRMAPHPKHCRFGNPEGAGPMPAWRRGTHAVSGSSALAGVLAFLVYLF